MLTFIFSFSIFLLGIYCFFRAISVLIFFVSKKDILKVVLLVIVFALGIFLNFSTFNFFGYRYNFLFAKIVFIGAVSIPFIIIAKKDDYLLFCLFVSVILSVEIYMFSGRMIPNIIYDSMPNRVYEHFEEKSIKREANKLDAKAELELILKEIKRDEILSCDRINDVISEKGYRFYNGIYCYAVEDKGDYWYVGMTYGDCEKLFLNSKFTKPVKIQVSKDNFNIIKVIE